MVSVGGGAGAGAVFVDAVIAGDHSNRDPPCTQKPIHCTRSIFTITGDHS